MNRGSSLRFIRWPMPHTLAGVVTRTSSEVSIFADVPDGAGALCSVRSGRCVAMSGSLSRADLLGGVLDGFDDLVVAGAAAQVARDAVADLGLARLRVAGEQRARRHQHAGRAEPALQAVLLPEALLQRVQRAAGGEALDGLDRRPVGLDREHGAALDRLAVEANRARAAARGVAADVRAGQPEVLADEVDEQRAGRDGAGLLLAVDRDGDLVLAHGWPPCARSTARRTARLVRTRTRSRL